MRILLYPMMVATALSPGGTGPWSADAARPEPVLEAPLGTTGTGANGPRRRMVIEQAADGLFYIKAQVNGTPVQFVVDSGSSVVVLNAQDARRAGVAGSARVAVDTANGSAAMRRARLDQVELAGQTLSGVEAAVVDRNLDVSLLGQSALSQLGSVTFRKTRLELE